MPDADRKVRLPMEAMRDIDRVVRALQRGRITWSKARGLCESIAFDGSRLGDIDPRELGESELTATLWLLQRVPDLTPAAAAEDLGLDPRRAAMLLSRLARSGKAERVGHGRYAARGRNVA